MGSRAGPLVSIPSLTVLCDFRTCGASEKDDGWSKPACARSSGLGSGDIRCPVGRCGTEGPPSPAGGPSLEVTSLRAALSPCIPGQNQHRTEHIPGCNVHLHLSHLPFHIKANQDFFSETHFIQFCTYGDIGPSPTHLSMYRSVENKAPYVHSQKLHSCAPGTWVWPSSAPCPSKVSSRASGGLPIISTNQEINRC